MIYPLYSIIPLNNLGQKINHNGLSFMHMEENLGAMVNILVVFTLEDEQIVWMDKSSGVCPAVNLCRTVMDFFVSFSH